MPETNTAPKTHRAAPIIVSVSEVTARKVNWLWERWIPRKAITILDGDPGLGKSTVTLDLAARVSRGWKMPPDCGPAGVDPADVLILSAEDDIATTIRPRLEAIGADLPRIHVFQAIKIGDKEQPPALPTDLEHVETCIREKGVALVIVDPFVAFLPGELDAHKDQDVRFALYRMKELAERTDCGILLVRHLNKIGHNVAVYRGGGSIGIVGAARSGLLIGRHPDEPNTRVLASVKSNLGRAPRSLTYKLESAGDVATIAWGQETDLGANDILTHPGAVKNTEVDRCAAALTDFLGDTKKPSTEVIEAMKQLGFSERTISRARKAGKFQAEWQPFAKRWMLSAVADPECQAAE